MSVKGACFPGACAGNNCSLLLLYEGLQGLKVELPTAADLGSDGDGVFGGEHLNAAALEAEDRFSLLYGDTGHAVTKYVNRAGARYRLTCERALPRTENPFGGQTPCPETASVAVWSAPGLWTRPC